MHRRDTEADRERDRLIVEGCWALLDDRAQVLREHDAAGQRRGRQHAGELFTAVAREQILAPDAGPDPLCEILEHRVAGEVAVLSLTFLKWSTSNITSVSG